MARCSQFYIDELARLQLRLIAIGDAITALSATGGVESYMLDTGQSIQRVTRSQVNSLQITYDKTLSQIETLDARCSGNGLIMKPAF